MAISQYSIQDWDVFSIPAGEGYLNEAKYKDPSSSEVRSQLQSQHSQMKKYVNETLVPAINDTYTKTETQNKINEAVFDSGNVTTTIVANMINNAVNPIQTSVTAISNAIGSLKFVALSQTDYDNLGSKDANTIYFIHS